MARFKIDFLESYDDNEILSELKRIAAKTGKSTVTKTDIKAHGRMSYGSVNRHFGSLRKALERAGLVPQRYMNATKEELLKILISLWEKTLEIEGRRPYQTDLKAYGFPCSPDLFKRKFGTWRKALVAAYNSINEDNVEMEVSTADTNTGNHSEPKEKRGSISIRKRFFVMKRDSFACVKCGSSGHGVRLEVDHKIPVASGGTDALDNLQILCFECNRGKRDSFE